MIRLEFKEPQSIADFYCLYSPTTFLLVGCYNFDFDQELSHQDGMVLAPSSQISLKSDISPLKVDIEFDWH